MPRHRQRPSQRPELRVPLTEAQRMQRKLVQARRQRDLRTRQRDHYKRRVRALERRRQWAERYVGFRIEYRLRGMWRRLRRLWRWHVQARLDGRR